MRSIVLSFVFVWAISFSVVASINAQSNPTENGNSTESVVPPVAENANVDDSESVPRLDLPVMDPIDNAPNPAEIDNNKIPLPSPPTNETPTNNANKNNNADDNDISDDTGMSRSWNEWENKFAPKNNNNNAPVPKGTLPPPPPYNGNINNYNNGYNQNQNQNVNVEQFENRPIPYLMWHRDPWTHRLSLAPYAPGYAASPNDFLVPPSDTSLWLTSFPQYGFYWRQPQYLGYYDPMPEVVSATPSRAQMILGYPNTPQTQYRDPYSGQPLNYNPANNPESILPVRESLLDRWRRRSLERRAMPLGQFPGQPPLQNQPIQSPLFGQPYEQNNQENLYQNPNGQLQQNQQIPQQQRYVRRPLGRFRQGLRDRIQRLGIFEALTQGRSAYNNQNQNPNNNYDEAPTYDGTN
ncbi:MAG: hypothetical protein LBT09_03750 [Planctomycetaceae bacterium]|nr:hypothetical protein [Planctomycetaceae bacterium]